MKKVIYLRILVVLVVAVMLGAGVYWLRTMSKPIAVTGENTATVQDTEFLGGEQITALQQPTAIKNARAGVASYGTDDLAVSAKLDYGEAKQIYDYRFQITSCSAITGLPSYGSLNVKQGASVVLENHDSVPHVLAIGTHAYTVSGAGFVVVTAPAAEKPVGYLVTCDGKGAGKLYVYP
ncbi:MAG: hypothetical protein WC817_00950 [Patescibacteria group bacterium]